MVTPPPPPLSRLTEGATVGFAKPTEATASAQTAPANRSLNPAMIFSPFSESASPPGDNVGLARPHQPEMNTNGIYPDKPRFATRICAISCTAAPHHSQPGPDPSESLLCSWFGRIWALLCRAQGLRSVRSPWLQRLPPLN